MAGTSSVVTAVNYGKGVRFDHFGLYGYDITSTKDSGYVFNPHELGILSPEVLLENDNVKFALTWDGLKVAKKEGGQILIGRTKEAIMQVLNSDGIPTFTVNTDGDVTIVGSLDIGDKEQIIEEVIETATTEIIEPVTEELKKEFVPKELLDGEKASWSFDPDKGMFMWIGPRSNNNLVLQVAKKDNGDSFLEVRGIVKAESGYIGGENGWIVEDGAIYTSSKALGSTGSFHMYSNG
jgi:hypothetical protein